MKKKIMILEILKEKNYQAITAISTLVLIVTYLGVQTWVSRGIQNLDIWFAMVSKLNLFLFFIFSILFGVLLSLQIYNMRNKACNIKKKTATATTGGIGAVLALAVPACPACLSVAALLLPATVALSFAQFIVSYSTELILSSLALLILGLFLLGGFEKS